MRERFAAMINNKDFTVDFEFEKMFMYDEAQRCFTQSRFGKSHLYLPRLKELGAFEMIELLEVGNEDGVAGWIGGSLHILFTHPDKDQTLKEVERLYDEMEKLAAMTPASVKAQDLNTDEIFLEVMKENVFLSVLMPALARVNQIAYRGRTQAHATLVILGVMQYAKEHGQLPQSLDVLVDEGLLKEVPIDPFSDKPLVYRKSDDGFILYGVGQNFTVDGGVPGTDSNGKPRNWGENGDYIFWPMDLQ